MSGETTHTLPIGRRHGTVEKVRAEDDEDPRTYEISFSSEEPYKRWDWDVGAFLEVLGHDRDEIDLSWLGSGNAPLLKDHYNEVDSVVGVLELACVVNKRGVARIRLSNTPYGDEIKAKIDEGTLSNVSVGYRVNEMKLVERNEDGPDTYRVTDWKPMECSLVAVPADPTVGVGRASEKASPRYEVRVYDADGKINRKEESEMGDDEDKIEDEAPDVLVKRAERQTRERMAAMMEYGKKFEEIDGPKIAQDVIADGGDIELLRQRINDASYAAYQQREEEIRKYREENDGRSLLRDNGAPDPRLGDKLDLGLTAKEVEGFSLCRAALGIADSEFAKTRSSYEMRVMEEASTLYQKSNARPIRAGASIPAEVLHAKLRISDRVVDMARRSKLLDAVRVLTVDSGSNAANLVADDFLAASFIDLLRNMSAITPFATNLSDLVGDVEIPRQSGAATASWLGETDSAALTDPTFDQITMSPKELGVAVQYSRKTLIQATPDIEMLIRMDFARVMALALDLAALTGDGQNNKPKGVMEATGIATVAIGTNGGAPTWAKMVEMESKVAEDNALMGDLRYVTNPKVRGKLKTTEKATNTAHFIWDGGSPSNPVNGYPVVVSNQVPSDLTKGSGSSLSAIVFGNLRDVIIGYWSGVDIDVNPYSGQLRRMITITAFQDVDVNVRHGESFAKIEDASTT